MRSEVVKVNAGRLIASALHDTGSGGGHSWQAASYPHKDKILRKNMMTLEMEYMTREIMGEKRGEERGLRLGEERGLRLGEERGKKLAREDARYSDVSSGLYSPEKGAELLNVSLEDFLKGMEEAGYKLPEGVKV